VGVEQREEMTVLVEVVHASVDRAQLQMDLERRFKEVVGVRLIVEVVEWGKTDEYTGTSKTSKIKRLLDRRVSG
jgi:phenylacetate-coenzyme A ligase PaaK-like adenylate-forming protein